MTTSRVLGRHLAKVMALAVILLLSFGSYIHLQAATTYTWSGATSTAWATATNWSPAGNPGSAPGDIVIIPAVARQPILTVAPANALASLTFTGTATLTITTVALTVTGTVGNNTAATTGTITGTGTLNCGSVSIGNSSSLTFGTVVLNVSGTTTVGGGTSGTLTLSSATGAKTFTGLVTINPGATWAESAAAIPTFRGGITNSGTFTASTGIHTFNTNAQALTGIFSIPNVTVTAITLTNNNTLTVGTALSGTGGLTQAASAILNIGGTAGISTLTATNSANTVNYSRAGAQTAKATTYYNLTLSGSGIKTFTTSPTVNNLLSMEGTATAAVSSGAFIYSATATLKYNSTGSITVSAEWISPFTASGGVMIISPYTFTLNSAKTFTNSPLIVKAGATLALGTYPLSLSTGLTLECGTTLAGSRITGTTGTLTPGGNITVIDIGTGTLGATITAPVALGGATRTFTIADDGTSAVDLTISGVISGTGFGITKDGTGTLLLSGANTFTGGTTLKAGTLNINNAQALGTIAGTFTINGGTIDNTSAAAITTLNYPQAWNADFAFTGTRALNLGTGTIAINADRLVTVSASTLTVGGTISAGAISLTKAGAGILSLGSNAVTLKGLTISTGTLTSTSGTLSLSGNFANNGTFTNNNGTIVFNGSTPQTISGLSATTFSKLTLNNSSGLSLTGAVNTTVTGVLTFSSGVITTNANTLILTATGSVARTSGHVAGKLQKNFATGANVSKTFEIGDASNYTPVSITISRVNTAGNLVVSTTTGDHPSLSTSTINTARSVNRYWTFTNGGLATSAAGYSATFTFIPGDLDVGANTTNFIVNRYATGAWTAPTTGTKTGTTTQATVAVASAFGDFAIGEAKPAATAISIASSLNPSCYGSPVTLTATVTSGGYPVASEGTVTFKEGATTVGTTGTLDAGGKGSITTSALAIGTHSITAVFNATNNFTSSTSSALSQVVNTQQWTGATGGNWENAANWCGSIPNSATNVVIPANTTVHITSVPATPAVCNNLTISSGAAVIINAGKALTVNGTLTNNAGNTGLLILSDANGTGSLLNNTANVPATVQRYIPGNGYHQVSIPLNQSASIISNLFLGSYLYQFVENGSLFTSMGTSTTTQLYVDKGYIIWYPGTSPTIYSFAGPLRNGNVSPALSYTSSSYGYNLVPNPYPSAIDWTAITTKNNLLNGFWVWNPSAGNYGAYGAAVGSGTSNTTKDIAVGQAFFVRATGLAPAITIPQTARLHSGQAFLKSTNAVVNQLHLTASGNNTKDEIIIAFNDAWSPGDDAADVYKMDGSADAVQLSSLSADSSKLSINALPFSVSNATIPLIFTLNTAAQVTFTATGLETFSELTPLLLEDKSTNIITDLRSISTYTFQYDPSNPANRFNLIFANITGTKPLAESNSGNVFISNGKLNVEVQSMNGQEATIRIYNIAGQQLNEKRMEMNGVVQLDTPVAPGVYVVKVTSGTKMFVSKFIKQ